MADKQENHLWIPKEVLEALVDTIAEKVNELAFKKSDAVKIISDESTNNEIPTAKAVNDAITEVYDYVDSTYNDHYAFTYNNKESDPAHIITYPAGVINTNFKSAGMNYDTGKFDYGDWENAWFIKKLRVVMLNFDGTELYEINPNDYTKKVNGESVGEEGNVMIAMPRVYVKIDDNGDDTFTVHVAERALDDGYECWAHHGIDGSRQDYCYMATYNGYYDGEKLRSLSGYLPTSGQTAQEEINRALANNIDDKKNWYTGVVADRFLIQILLLLIGKSTDTQGVFGRGFTSENNVLSNTGVMDDKGFFWGSNTSRVGVKIFGIENFWGNIWNRVAGWISVNGVQKFKLTYGTEDGSTVSGYNLDANGYITPLEVPTFTDSTDGYITRLVPTKYGLIPDASTATGSGYTYVSDYIWKNDTITAYALVNNWAGDLSSGAFSVYLRSLITNATSTTGASLSYKKGGEEK